MDARKVGPRHWRKVRVLAFCLAWMAIASAHGQALMYGGDEAFAPFESLSADGRPEGFQIDLMRALGRELGREVEIDLQPWAATVEAFRAGRVDVVAMVETRERRAFARFLPGHASPAFGVYLPRGMTPPRAIQDLQGRALAVLDHAPMLESLDRWLAGIDGPILTVADSRAALQAVQRGQAEMALLPQAYADPLLAQGEAPSLVLGLGNLSLQTYSLAVARDNEALAQALEAALAKLEADGTLPSLRDRWLDATPGAVERQALQRDLVVERDRTKWVVVVSVTTLLLASGLLWRRHRALQLERGRRDTVEAALAQTRQLLERAFQHNPEPMLLIDHSNGVIRDTNDALVRLLGVERQALEGQPMRVFKPFAGGQALRSIVRTIAVEGGFDAMPVTVTTANGEARQCLLTAQRVEAGVHQSVLCVLRDVTDRFRSDAVFRDGYEQWRHLQEDGSPSVPSTLPPPAEVDDGNDRIREFTRAISHDLRAPLMAIQGFMGLLRERIGQGHTEEALEYSFQVEKATRRMNAMIEALCNLARVDQQPLQRRSIDMQALAVDTWALIGGADPSRVVEWRIDPLPAASGDPDLVAQVWQNLLHNAWKYTARTERPRVRVDSFKEAGRTWYRVTDNGAGFDMAHARDLFQPFRRMHPSQQFEGTGIGLSMVHRIVRHHGGEVNLRSEPGVGTIASFTLDEPA